MGDRTEYERHQRPMWERYKATIFKPSTDPDMHSVYYKFDLNGEMSYYCVTEDDDPKKARYQKMGDRIRHMQSPENTLRKHIEELYFWSNNAVRNLFEGTGLDYEAYKDEEGYWRARLKQESVGENSWLDT